MCYLLEKDCKKQVLLYIEIDFINVYIDLECIRVKNIDISFDLEGDLNGYSFLFVLLIILVENVFKYGIKKLVVINFVYFELKVSVEEIIFEVMNFLYSNSFNRSEEIGIGL